MECGLKTCCPCALQNSPNVSSCLPRPQADVILPGVENSPRLWPRTIFTHEWPMIHTRKTEPESLRWPRTCAVHRQLGELVHTSGRGTCPGLPGVPGACFSSPAQLDVVRLHRPGEKVEEKDRDTLHPRTRQRGVCCGDTPEVRSALPRGSWWAQRAAGSGWNCAQEQRSTSCSCERSFKF